MTKISDLTALTGAGVAVADDLLAIVDMSLAGSARNKKITAAELREAIAPGTAAALDIDVDDTLAADSDSLIPTQQAVKAYVDANVGGANDLDDLTDVDLTGLADGDTLVYDLASGDFLPIPLPGGGAGGTVPDGGSDGQVLTKQSGTDQDVDWESLPAPPSTAWALAGTGQTATGVYDQAVDGTKANVDFVGLAGKTDIMIVAKGVTLSVSGIAVFRVSVDNGASYFATSGDYVRPSSAGVETATTGVTMWDTAATAARTGIAAIYGAQVIGPFRLMHNLIQDTDNVGYLFVADVANDIDAVRLIPSAGGNITGGKIYCLAR